MMGGARGGGSDGSEEHDIFQKYRDPVLYSTEVSNKNSSGDEIANVNFLRPHRTILQNIIRC